MKEEELTREDILCLEKDYEELFDMLQQERRNNLEFLKSQKKYIKLDDSYEIDMKIKQISKELAGREE